MRPGLQIAVLIAALIPEAVAGQVGAGLRGTVSTTNAEHKRTYLSQVQVSLQCDGSSASPQAATKQTTTDDSGRFLFSDLRPGSCTVKVIDPQLDETTAKVEILANDQAEVDLSTQVRQVQQNVNVTDEQPQVDTSSSETAAQAISQTTLQSAPLISERFQDALPLLPGVVRGPDGLINIKGTRAGQSGTLVNSASAADPVTGEEAISLPLEAVASVKVLDNPFSAQYGQFAGGITEVETRSGTDKWKYLVTDFFPRFRVRAGHLLGLESVTPRLTVAGPLIEDKLFVFQSFDYRFVRVPVESLPPLARDQQFETFSSSTQVDWSISGGHHLSANFAFYPEITKYADLNTFNPQPVTPDLHERGYMLSLHDGSTFGQSLLETAFSVKRSDLDVYPSSGLTGSMILFPEQNSGTWYNREDRNSWMYQWSQVFHKGDLKAWGTHLLSIGYSFDHSDYDGRITNQPVNVLREDHTTSEVIQFSGRTALSASRSNVATYVQDHWSPSQLAAFDLGLRVEHDSLATSNVVAAPRIGFVFAPTRDNKTALRGGIGLYYDKVPLNIPTFLAYPAETVTRFDTDGSMAIGEPASFRHSLASPGLRLPYSVAWTLQVDREITPAIILRLGYEDRSTHRDFVVEPFQLAGADPELSLMNSGRQRYREFQATVRWKPSESVTVYSSFVRSYAHGDLNTFEQFFGNFPNPVIRANQFGPLPYDAPNRLLFWGSFLLPFKIEFWPVLDVHSGLPFSKVNDDLDFVGQRDSHRFPTFASLDVQIVRPFQFAVFHKRRTVRAGIKIFNATNHFNPRDVQNNISSPEYGALFNSVGPQFRGKFEFDF